MPLRPPRRAPRLAVATTVVAGLLSAVAATSTADAAPASTGLLSSAAPAPAAVAAAPSVDTVGGVEIHNSFVSAVGWVKPGQEYPSRIILRNTGDVPALALSVRITAPQGSTILRAGAQQVDASTYTWTVPTLAAGETRTLVLGSRAATYAALPTIVWRDLSTTATLTVGTASKAVTSHGPKVIPQGSEYDTARYGDRPFPVVPVAYTDRDYVAGHNGGQLDKVINDPEFAGSTFNLFQEMSLGQLFPHGTVPSAGIASKDFAYPGANTSTGGEGAFPFTSGADAFAENPQTCKGITYADNPLPENPLYTKRIENGVYQLPGQTEYYGSDGNGSAIPGAVAGVAALMQIDSGCGPTGKLVVDAAAIADPEIDYSDYDTDKDGVVDFFMAVFAGCGGNGTSQLAICTDDNGDLLPYDNVWPHSSSLEYYYSDPVTKLPGFTTDDQLKDLEGNFLWYTDGTYTAMTTTDMGDALKVFVRVGPYNVNPETAIDHASVISHEYGHSLGLPDFYSLGSRETYGDWNLMATDKSQNMDAYSRQELGWVVPEVLPKGVTLTETGIPDSKEDINTITWKTPAGEAYTLVEGQDGVGRVQNSQMYVAKLPGRILLDEGVFAADEATGNEGASAKSLWWSRSGNDFGCATDGKGHNIDIAIPALADLPAGTPVTVEFKSRWDIEWDYDYGFVLTSTNGEDFASNESEMGFTTSNTDPLAGNPNQNGCQTAYDHGITGTSGSYAAGSEAVDRKAGEYPAPVFLTDRYDISELAGAASPVLRFSYATDPGLARPGWFVDDLLITAGDQVLYETDFEDSGTPDDPAIFNGGCREGLGTGCTQGWQYVIAGDEGPNDHAYYLEMRDRSGFDFAGFGQIDRDPLAFEAGFYNSYTDEAHGYGNAGTDDPPAQSPLDSLPQPGNNTPNLADAAWRVGDTPFSDHGDGWVDNYEDPQSADGNWHFAYDCLSYEVTALSGESDGPEVATAPVVAGDLTGTVRFAMGAGCGAFDYGYDAVEPVEENTPPKAVATATPTTTTTGATVTFDGSGSSDAETPKAALVYEWDFGDGTKGSGMTATHAYSRPGSYLVTLLVRDADGAVHSTTLRVTVTAPNASPSPQPTGSPTATPSAGLSPSPTATPTSPTATTSTSPTPTASSCGKVTTKVKLRIYRRSNLTQVGRPKLKARLLLSCGKVTPQMGRWVIRIDGRKYRSFAVQSNTLKKLVKAPGFLTSGEHTVRVSFRPKTSRYPKARSNPATYLRR